VITNRAFDTGHEDHPRYAHVLRHAMPMS
jgi:hypothetical protein